MLALLMKLLQHSFRKTVGDDEQKILNTELVQFHLKLRVSK